MVKSGGAMAPLAPLVPPPVNSNWDCEWSRCLHNLSRSASKTLDSYFHTEITLFRGSDGPRASPSRLLLSFTQVPHAQQYMITRICGTRARFLITFLQNGFSICVSPDPFSSKRRGGTARLEATMAMNNNQLST